MVTLIINRQLGVCLKEYLNSYLYLINNTQVYGKYDKEKGKFKSGSNCYYFLSSDYSKEECENTRSN